jgi:hypothetical protein
MHLSTRVLRFVGFFCLTATVAFAQPFRATGSTDAARKRPSAVFGAKIIDVDLTFDKAALQSLLIRPTADVPAKMTVTDIGGATEAYDVKVRSKGRLGSVRSLQRKPAFKVKLVNDARSYGLEHLTLNNMVQDQTMLHEALAYEVYEAAGVPVPTTGYARVTVNGQAYGLYLNLETPDKHFLNRRFGDDSGILYEAAYGVDLRAGDVEKFELDEGEDLDHKQLKTFIRALDTPGDAVFYGAPGRDPQADTASFLAMMAAQALLADWDNYYSANNYRIYWNPSANRWFFIPTGLDQTFTVKPTPVFGARGLLFQKCLASERCTRDYADKVRNVARQFERLGLSAKMDALLAVIDDAARADPRKEYDEAAMTAARESMRSFIMNRPNDVRAALSCIDGDSAAIGGCAGSVAVSLTNNQCVEAVPGKGNVARNGIVVTVSGCRGGASQRWRLIAMGDVFALTSVSGGNCLDVKDGSPDAGAVVQQSACTGIDSQRFSLRSVARGTQIVAKHSGKCVAVAPLNPRRPALVQVACASDAAQTWSIQRSIYK